MGSFVPFGGFFSTPSDLKLPFSGFKKEIRFLPFPIRPNLPCHLVQTKEGLESVSANNSTSSAPASTGSAKWVTTDLNLRMCPVKDFSQPQYASSSCLDSPRSLKTGKFMDSHGREVGIGNNCN
ncbi:unnamed protein product [Microthlaspi erraticum]|uniref:Uncharacterized protein n=1 Tax=Microthlaspi erraticum TaxID=1685480 RepID=A0A6D2HI04_9BRAS|nr:unnamed protein product [Microthlaspi erraticum]